MIPTSTSTLPSRTFICDVYQGGDAVTPFTTGICTEAELPYTATTYSPLYPLQPGWQQRVVVSTAELSGMSADVATMKAELKAYGPLDIGIYDGDFNQKTLGTGAATTTSWRWAM